MSMVIGILLDVFLILVVSCLTLLIGKFIFKFYKTYSFTYYCVIVSLVTAASLFLSSFVLLLFGLFTIPLLLGVNVVLLCGVVFLFRKFVFSGWRKFFRAFRFDWWQASALIGAAIFGLLTSTHLAEWNIGSTLDASNYVNISSHFVNTGSFFADTSINNAFGPCKSFFCPSKFTPLYLHVFPVLLAFFKLLSFKWGSIVFHFLLASLPIVSFFELCKKLYSPAIGLIGSGFLMISAPQILYAKEPMSEVLAQLFLFISLLCLVTISTLTKRSQLRIQIEIILSGLSLLLLLLTKLDSVLVLFPYILLVSYLFYKRKVKGTSLRVLSLILLLAGLYHLGFAYQYVSGIFFLNGERFPISVIIICGTGLYFFALSLIRHSFINRFAFPDKVVRVICISVSIILIEILLIRLQLGLSSLISNDNRDLINLLRISYFTSPWVLFLGCVGYFSSQINGRRFEALLCFGLFVISVYLLFNTRHNSELFWWIRRYLVVVIPSILIFALYILNSLSAMREKLLIIPIIILSIYGLLNAWIPAVSFIHNKGLNDDIILLNNTIGDADRVSFLSKTDFKTYGTPLLHIFDKSVYFNESTRESLEGKSVLVVSELNEELMNLVDQDEVNCTPVSLSYVSHDNVGLTCGKRLCTWNEIVRTYDENIQALLHVCSRYDQ